MLEYTEKKYKAMGVDPLTYNLLRVVIDASLYRSTNVSLKCAVYRIKTFRVQLIFA